MPCSDLTEQLTIVIDHQHKLLDYNLQKISCGKQIGANQSLLKLIQHKQLDEILASDLNFQLNENKVNSKNHEYLAQKHFQAILLGISAFWGQDKSNNPCSINDIIYEPNTITIKALIKLELKTEKIKPCYGIN
jgi:hypothetical protein